MILTKPVRANTVKGSKPIAVPVIIRTRDLHPYSLLDFCLGVAEN